MIYIESKKKAMPTILKKYPDAKILDVTSKAQKDWVKLSPFYPHGGIPIPFSEGDTAMSVEGIWQGLKVFESGGIDRESFRNATMKNLKRTARKYGKPLGHQQGTRSKELLGYIDARIQIYLPSYLWVLENKVASIVNLLKEKSLQTDIVLLDYETNCDVLNANKPLSHAYLVKAFIEEQYPSLKESLEKGSGKKDNVQLELF